MKKQMVELFAGVGGFRVGFEMADSEWQTVFANQWEPKTKNQFAFKCYKEHFESQGGITDLSNCDIAKVPTAHIPSHTLLVGGFPCQDYSVASTGAQGIQGKKGVLWWEIERIVRDKKPPFILLENVDRLLKSPSKQRGRDFGIILACLNNLGYGVEWRVINAAEYGFAQRRRRTFIFAFKNSTKYFSEISQNNFNEIISEKGLFAKTFSVRNSFENDSYNTCHLVPDIQEISDIFKFDFKNSGIMINGKIYTQQTEVFSPVQQQIVLGDILENNVSEKYFIKENDLPNWEYMKGPKAIERVSKDGHSYTFKEGGIAFPDYLDRPARTMLTSESSKNRSTHIILDPEQNRLRKLTPLECERINGFPDNWTNTELTDTQRYFCMGNALVVGIIKELAFKLNSIIEKEK